jgi:apolipoprotein N-acyltransferase
VIPAFVAFLYFIYRSHGMRAAFFIGLCFDIGRMGAAYSWGFFILPLNWLGISNPITGFCIVFLIWLVYSIILALPGAFFGLILRAVGVRSLLFAPLLWVIFAYIDAVLYSLAAWGQGSVIGADSSFGWFGYALAWAPGLLWGARLGGAYALTFIVAVLGAVFYYIVCVHPMGTATRWRIAGVVYGLLLVVGYFVPGPVTTTFNPPVVYADGLRIVPVSTLIQPALTRSDSEFAAIEEQLAGDILDAIHENPDVIVLPEYSGYFKRENLLSKERAAYVREQLHQSKVLLIDSDHSDEEEGRQGNIIFYDGEIGQVVERQQKRFLIALGEYLPNIVLWSLNLSGYSAELDAIVKYRTYNPSLEPFATRVFSYRGAKLGVLACSETFSPLSYKEVSDAGADVLINIASHSWIRSRSPILFRETLAMAYVHAAYTGKTYVQASNYAPSYVLYPR